MTAVDIWWTTYPPPLVNVVFECPLWQFYHVLKFIQHGYGRTVVLHSHIEVCTKTSEVLRSRKEFLQPFYSNWEGLEAENLKASRTILHSYMEICAKNPRVLSSHKRNFLTILALIEGLRPGGTGSREFQSIVNHLAFPHGDLCQTPRVLSSQKRNTSTILTWMKRD